MGSVSVFSNPLITIKVLLIVSGRALKKSLFFLLRNFIIFGLIAALIIVPRFIDGSHQTTILKIDEIAYFAAYWIILGVLSSIGLGTGLHTFILYLGPHIAQVAMVSYECNAIPEMLPSRYKFTHFASCPEDTEGGINFWKILMAVQLEGFLWGFGTALGELPPYMVAKAARLAGKKDKEIEEVEDENNAGLISKAKKIIYSALHKNAFLTVLICASIPNPLFDLAGITCGHFLIPFATFFIATSIGKSIIKVHLQMFSIILMFSGETINKIVQGVEKMLPFLQGKLHQMLEKQKAKLHAKKADEGEKPFVAKVWDWVIIAMVAYFLVSIVNSIVNEYLDNEEKKEVEEKKEK